MYAVFNFRSSADSVSMPVRMQYPVMPVGPTTYILPASQRDSSIIRTKKQLEFLKLMKPFTANSTGNCRQENNNFQGQTNLENDLNELTLSDLDGPIDDVKVPKRVKFADTVGLDLVHIRHMTAGRDTPPDLSCYHFSDLDLCSSKKQSREEPTLTLGFPQPVSDYSQFRELLDTNNVSLESISINGLSIVGTIKVKNLAFHKTVFARFTSDNWATCHDVNAYYVNNGLANGQGMVLTSQIDTFSFTYDLSAEFTKCDNIQFAVCFRCEGQEFWDNNIRKNYVIHLKTPVKKKSPAQQHRASFDFYADHIETNWTEFAIWKNLRTDYTPYW